MVDKEYSIDTCKSLKISIGTVKRILEMLKFVSDLLKTKQICKHAFKKLPYLLRYVTDQYKTKQMHDKTSRKWWNINVCS